MMTKLNHTFGDDGVFWISYPDFLKHFPSINRVRLFDSSWSVGQQWTCVRVPWTVDYLDTKFEFTISERGPVVIVLAQPDDRYFYGLRGRYLYSLHFRIYKEGDPEGKYIVRSMHNSGGEKVFTRSVSAEIEDLEPGRYGVVFKVTAVRSMISSTAEESILKYAVERKEKLLQVGRRFDYAQTKGNLRAMEVEVRRMEKEEKREKMKRGWRKARKLNKEERERARKRKERVKQKMREKRKELERKRTAKNKALRDRNRNGKKRRHVPVDGRTDPGAGSEVDREERVNDSPVSNDKAQTADNLASVVEPAMERDTDDKSGVAVLDATEMIPDAVSKDDGAVPADLSKKLSSLDIDSRPQSRRNSHTPPSPLDQDHTSDDYSYASPFSPPAELEDDDFSWDSDLYVLFHHIASTALQFPPTNTRFRDGPVSSSSDSDSSSEGQWGSSSRVGKGKDKNGIFGEDKWQALCVLGLRVYAKGSEAVKVRVVKAANSS
jgi:hypothetical protein